MQIYKKLLTANILNRDLCCFRTACALHPVFNKTIFNKAINRKLDELCLRICTGKPTS